MLSDHLPSYLITPSNPTKPLLLVDADEVLLYFIEAIEDYCQNHQLILRLESFQITGNILRADTQEALTAAEVKNLIADFFVKYTHRQRAVDGAADGLASLSGIADIAILTNIPAEQASARAQNLAAQGMDYPVIANSGGKGEMLAKLAAPRTGFIGFIDDLPPQHSSVAATMPHSYRVHHVADVRLRSMVPKAPDAHVRIDQWPILSQHLGTRMAG